jgi:hypothetical protein
MKTTTVIRVVEEARNSLQDPKPPETIKSTLQNAL